MSALAALTIVLCRPRDQSWALVKAIEAVGAQALMMPLLEVAPAADGGAELNDALAEIDRYDWITFTSTNAVNAVVGEANARWPESLRVAVVGPATADLLRQLGYPVDFVSAGGTASDLALALPVETGQRVLAPLGDRASNVLEDLLVGRGAVVNRVEAYRTLWADVTTESAAGVCDADFVFLTSPAIAERFAAVTQARRPPAVCIGPTTATAAAGLGLEVAAVATKRTPDGLIDALLRTIES